MPKNADQSEAARPASGGGASESLGRVAILWTIAVVVFMSGWGVFLYRGFVPGALIEGADFRIIYSSARAWVYGVAAKGEAGVTGVLETMKRELRTSMALIGKPRVADIDRSVLQT